MKKNALTSLVLVGKMGLLTSISAFAPVNLQASNTLDGNTIVGSKSMNVEIKGQVLDETGALSSALPSQSLNLIKTQ